MIEGKIRVTGMKELARNMEKLIPEPKKQRSMLNRSLSYVARRHILPMAKANLRMSERSGALAEAIDVRARSKNYALARGRTAVVEVGVNRNDPKAAAMYSNYYGNLTVIASGIRHGHLIEFGFHPGGSETFVPGNPWLGPATVVQPSTYANLFAASLKKKLEAHIRRNIKTRARAA